MRERTDKEETAYHDWASESRYKVNLPWRNTTTNGHRIHATKRSMVFTIALATIVMMAYPSMTALSYAAPPATNNMSNGMPSYANGMPFMSGALSFENNITSSINILTFANTALHDNLKISLTKAIQNAESEVGGKSTPVEAGITVVGGEYLAYKVVILGTDGMIHIVIVDAGNGDILAKQHFTLKEIIAMLMTRSEGLPQLGMYGGMFGEMSSQMTGHTINQMSSY